jgi:hypothetical protein
MRGVLIEGKTAGCQRSDPTRVSGRSNLESRDDEQGARNRHQVLKHRYDKVWNLERAYQSGTHLIPRKPSYYATNRAQSASDGSRLPPR